MTQPLVAVSSDIREFDNYVWHCAPQTYLAAAMDVAATMAYRGLRTSRASSSSGSRCSRLMWRLGCQRG